MNEGKFNPIDMKDITTPQVTKESGVIEMNFPIPKPKLESNEIEMTFKKEAREKKKQEEIEKIMEKLKNSYAA